MAISLGILTTYISSSAGTTANFTHSHNGGVLIIRLGGRGTSNVPANFQLTVNGAAVSPLANGGSINTSSRAITLFYGIENAPTGNLNIVVSWNNQANLAASVLDVLGATLNGYTAMNDAGYASSVSLSIACPQGGIALDSVDANNGRDFSPLNNVVPHYNTLQTNTGDSDVSHRAGYKFADSVTDLGWQIISTSNYVYAVVSLAPAPESAPLNTSAFMFYFGG